MADSVKTIDQDIKSLFSGTEIPTDLLNQYITGLTDNLAVTEKALNKDFFRIIIFFLAFVVLDSGLIEKLSISGTEIKRSGYILISFPLLISYFYYQFNCRVVFAHDIRICLALLLKRIHPELYFGGFDLLLHYPSIRNVESLQGKHVSGKLQNSLLNFSTTLVSAIFLLSPILALIYVLYRIGNYPDLPLAALIGVIIISTIFVIRSSILTFRPPMEPDHYSQRKKGSS